MWQVGRFYHPQAREKSSLAGIRNPQHRNLSNSYWWMKPSIPISQRNHKIPNLCICEAMFNPKTTADNDEQLEFVRVNPYNRAEKYYMLDNSYGQLGWPYERVCNPHIETINKGSQA